MVVIKKYSNRRLYDTDQSRYITLDDLAARIRSGVDVRVVDAKSGADLTQGTLTQIIMESRGAARLLPVPLLMQLVRMEDDTLGEFFGQFVAWSLELYNQMSSQLGAHVRPGAAPFNPFAGLGFGAGNPFASLFRGAGGAAPWSQPGAPAQPAPQPAEPEAEVDAAGAPETDDGVADMRRELDELKAMMRQLVDQKK